MTGWRTIAADRYIRKYDRRLIYLNFLFLFFFFTTERRLASRRIAGWRNQP